VRVALPIAPAVGLSAATCGALALGAAGVLGTATTGITVCLFSATTGADCPFCGLTRGVAALGAGDIGTAVALNPLTPLAVGLALAVPLTLMRRRALAVPAAALWALLAVIVVSWLLRLAL